MNLTVQCIISLLTTITYRYRSFCELLGPVTVLREKNVNFNFSNFAHYQEREAIVVNIRTFKKLKQDRNFYLNVIMNAKWSRLHNFYFKSQVNQ